MYVFIAKAIFVLLNEDQIVVYRISSIDRDQITKMFVIVL